MNIFLTGATGLLGAHTALELLQHGHRLRLLVRNPAAAQRWFAERGHQVDDLIVADMSDLQAVRAAMTGCDAVVHAAAVIDLDTRRARTTESVNVQGLRNVVGSACELGIGKILYVSSISAIFHAGAEQLDESVAVASSRDPYAHSKELCELQVREWQQQGYPVMTTYPTGVFGPDDPKLSQSNEGLLLLCRDILPLTSSGLQFVDVRDVARAHRLLLESSLANDKTQERYMLAGHYARWPELAQLLRQAGVAVRTMPIPGSVLRGAGRMMDLVRHVMPVPYPLSHESTLIVTRFPPCDSSRLLNKTGMQFRPAQETLSDTVTWLRQQAYLTK